MLAGAAIVSYLTRASISTAATTIQADLQLDAVQMGYVLGGFFMGYIWLQIPGGWLGGRIGARITLTTFALLWSLMTLASALAPSYEVLRWSRIAMGAAQAGLFAVIIKALADWFPESRRGTAGAVITGSMSVGAVIASGLTVRLLDPLGWRGAFEVYALVGVVWAVAFALWFRNTPAEHSGVNLAELKLIREVAPIRSRLHDPELDLADVATHAKDKSTVEVTSFGAVLMSMALSVSMWALCIQAFFRAFGYALFITWFPAYLEQGFGVATSRAGDLSMLPLAGVVVGSFLGGPVVDVILVRTGSRWLSRSGVAAFSLGTCALATLAATFVNNPLAAVAMLSLGALLSGLASPTTWAATMDISGRHTALGFAIMNMSGNIGAIACPIAVGYLIAHIRATNGNWDWVLYMFAAIYLAGSIAWLFLNPNQSAVVRRVRA
ncbi:MFS transporter, ACS family, glucarate transporter [Singulisphaera sp. GP187]|uniref:MFS transporter n=1 Tax=Singulisphaera sp. GP187 TaxID=1882752 RepID=UPI0009295C30|nr:MFS transporter [Singulisphaera sp. GP187]SIO22895.1 MFS transporter, ACS family, glucarate transporter [Singulisphaera sp. GP187]